MIVKFTTKKFVEVETEHDIKDGIYYIGRLSDVAAWGKYYAVERIEILNSKVLHKIVCLYLDSIQCDGIHLQHGMDKFDFETIMKIETGVKEQETHGQRVFISEDTFLAYYNETIENVNKAIFK